LCSWWWVEELPETCRAICRSKLGGENIASCWLYFRVILVMHGHMNVTFLILLLHFFSNIPLLSHTSSEPVHLL
jgi:hypothetical protein